jgi:sugar transferase EpsL
MNGDQGQERRKSSVRQGLPRWVDVLAASTGLIVALPLLLITALLIKVETRGPVFYRQIRVGRGGSCFELIKLRTMQHNARPDDVWEPLLSDDPRITKVGRILRRTSIDEIPNLLNVLRGDMALVGPRPTIPAQVAQYTPFQRRRLEVRPGITGLAQVSGRNTLSWPARIVIDVDYVERRSVRLDLQILAQTVMQVLRRKDVTLA